MLQTVEGILEVDGQIRWLEPLHVKHPSRLIVTVLPEHNGAADAKGAAGKALQNLRKSRLPESARPSLAEIEAQITEARESWE